MCVGVPMQILECQGEQAVCNDRGTLTTIDMTLVGEQPAGTWVLVFLGAAREVVTPENAALVGQALEAVGLAMYGGDGNIDALFPDLAGREPELPPHLRNQLAKTPS